MGSDYERWKKQRQAEQARREQEREAPRRAAPAPFASPAAERGAEPRRPYQGPIPPAPEPGPAAYRARRSNSRGCLGCTGLLLGGLILLLLIGALATFLYWRQIEQRGQVNVLVLGIDERPDEGPTFRSDTMILAGFDPRDREVALLSVPRDLWVVVPGYGENRINTAHFFGGPELAVQTVRAELGVPLPYYIRLNFNGFVSLIDALGGITVEVREPLHDENYPTPDYGVTTIDIPAGEQQMDGATALIYARSRYSTSDFDRARRQQEIVAAIRDKVAQPDTLLKAPALWGAFQAATQSNIPQAEWPALALILVRSEIQRTVIGPGAVQEFITAEGAQVLLPQWNVINPILARYFE